MCSMEKIDPNMPILIVDQYQSMRRAMGQCLRKLGFNNISEAETGTSAIEQINTSEFKLIISDWHMPDVNAQELLQELRTHGIETPVLVVAESQERSQVPEFKPDQKAELIVKPICSSILEEKLSHVLSEDSPG